MESMMQERLESSPTPRVVAINISETKGIPKTSIASGEFIADFGLKGDAHGGNWHRQVSFLARESIDRMTALGVSGLTPGRFAENITTENIVLDQLAVGTKLVIGDVTLRSHRSVRNALNRALSIIKWVVARCPMRASLPEYSTGERLSRVWRLKFGNNVAVRLDRMGSICQRH